MNRQALFIARCAALFSAARMFIGATSTLYLISKNISAPDVMYLKGVQAAALLVLEIPLGWWADRVGRKYPIVLGMLAGGAWLATTAAAPSIFWLYVAEVCNAVSLALIAAALQAEFIDRFNDSSPVDTHEAESLSAGVSYFTRLQFQGMAVGAGVGGVLYGFSPSGTWWVAAMLAFATAAVFAVFYRPRSGRHTDYARSERHGPALNLWATLRSSHKGTVTVVSVSGLLYASFQVSIQYWQISLQDTGAGSGTGVMSAATFGAVFVIILFVQARINAVVAFSRTRTAVLAAVVVIPPVIWLVSLLLNFPWEVLAVEIWLYFWLYRAAMVVIDTLVNAQISSETRATVISARSTIARVITLAVSPLVSAGVREWSASGAVAVVAAIASLSAIGIVLMDTGQYFRKADSLP